MSTRSNILYQLPNGQVQVIYCHFDGYPEHMRPVLKGYYATEQEVRDLVALGDLSVCDHPKDTIAYHRDRGRELNIVVYDSLESLDADDLEEYAYLFKNGEWYWNDWNNRIWRKL
ncbi:MAG: hypothetical protein N2235_01405 [Fischerella sp.]|nr:hypothetical protein [Fischerella sp.]